MTPEANAALVLRFVDAFNQARPEEYAAVFDPGYACHMGDGTVAGLPANLEMEAQFRAAFSDARWEIQDLIAAGDKVVVRRSWRMTHTGPFQGLPPSGRTITGTGIDIFRVSDGKLVEQWTESDNLSFMQQLGAMPQTEREPGL
jgi:steroid delta-isomerase-like uncharacterized protein